MNNETNQQDKDNLDQIKTFLYDQNQSDVLDKTIKAIETIEKYAQGELSNDPQTAADLFKWATHFIISHLYTPILLIPNLSYAPTTEFYTQTSIGRLIARGNARLNLNSFI